MEENTVKIVLEYLDKIALKLGLTAEQLWPWFIREQYVEALWHGMVLLMSVIGTILTYTICKGHDFNEDSLKTVLGIVSYLFFGVLAVASVFLFTNSLTNLCNPEYHALKDLIEQLSNLQK